MIFNDAIHAHTEEKGKDDNVKGINTPKINECLCTMHDV